MDRSGVIDRSEAARGRLDRATAHLDPPFAVVDADAFEHNAVALAGLAAGKPIRVASKSVRCRDLLREVLSRPGWRGVMSFTLAEALWLIDGDVSNDILLGYPVADRTSLARLCSNERYANAVTLMVDSIDQLDFIDSVCPPDGRPPLRICLDLDASWRPLAAVHVGVRRSPLHSAAAVGALAADVARRRGFRLVGLMSYEAHIAGLGDAPAGRPLYGAAIRRIQALSMPELLGRRGAAVSAAREHADLEFVNGGGTGSVEFTASDPAVTEIAAGSGLFGPHLFDTYRGFTPAPAAAFALSVVRKPTPQIATVLGGGWIASGPPARDRVPLPVWPQGLSLLSTEMAGEVQTPVSGKAAAALTVGDRVWFRHCKAGELSEHVDRFALVHEGKTIGAAVTYRGEGKAFL